MNDMLMMVGARIAPAKPEATPATTGRPVVEAAAAVAGGAVPSSVVKGGGESLPVPGKVQPDAAEQQEKRELSKAVDRINGYVQTIQRKLEFSLDNESGSLLVKVVDGDTGELIRQIPPEVALRLARNLGDDSSGMLIEMKA